MAKQPKRKSAKPDRNPKVQLTALREESGLKRADLAVEFKVDPTTIWYWETYGPPRDVIPQLAHFFNVPIAEIMGWEEPLP